MPEDLEQTIRRLDEEVRQRPGYAALLYRAGLLLATGRLDDALRDCDAAAAMRPNASRPLFMRSEILRRQGREREAEDVMARAQRLPKGGDGFEVELQQVLARVEGGVPRRPSAQRARRPRRPPHGGTGAA